MYTGAMVGVPPSFAAYKLTTDYPARVRVYLDATYQANDLSRGEGVDPTGDHGMAFEVITTAGATAPTLVPPPFFIQPAGATAAYVTITNKDSVSRTITTTFNILGLE
jgi:hypothetical protein